MFLEQNNCLKMAAECQDSSKRTLVLSVMVTHSREEIDALKPFLLDLGETVRFVELRR